MLIVLHVVFSMLFMTFAGAVYSAHVNWRTKHAEISVLLDKEKKGRSDAEAERDRLTSDLKTQLDGQKNLVTQLTGEKTGLGDQVRQLDAENKRLKTALDTERELASLNSVEAAERTKESQAQRAKNSDLYTSRNQLIKELQTATDRNFQLEFEVKQAKEKQQDSLNQIIAMRQFLASKNLPTDVSKMVIAGTPAPIVRGKVVEAEKARRGSLEFIEVSLGSDDGMRAGYELSVYREGKYLGKIRLDKVAYQSSVGVVIDKTKNSVIERGDNVSTEF